MSGFLEHFWALKDHDVRVRAAAGRRIVEDQEVSSDYAKKRLVKGLFATDQASRQGFASVLTEMLVCKTMDVAEFLTLVETSYSLTKGATRAEQKDFDVGQLTAVLILCRSGRIAEVSSLQKIIAKTLELANRRSWMRECVFESLGLVSTSVPAELFSSDVLPELQPLVTVPIHSMSSDQFSLRLGLHDLLDGTDPAAFDATGMKTLLQFDAAQTQYDQLFLAPSDTFPRVHSMWSKLVLRLVSSDCATAFWTNIVERLLLPSSVKRKYVAVALFQLYLLHIPTEAQVALTPALLHTLRTALKDRKHKLHGIAAATVDQLLEVAQENASLCAAAAVALASIDFDAVTHTGTVRKLNALLDSETAADRITTLAATLRDPEPQRSDLDLYYSLAGSLQGEALLGVVETLLLVARQGSLMQAARDRLDKLLRRMLFKSDADVVQQLLTLLQSRIDETTAANDTVTASSLTDDQKTALQRLLVYVSVLHLVEDEDAQELMGMLEAVLSNLEEGTTGFASDVLDICLSLLTRPSALCRELSASLFRCFLPLMSTDLLQGLFEELKQKAEDDAEESADDDERSEMEEGEELEALGARIDSLDEDMESVESEESIHDDEEQRYEESLTAFLKARSESKSQRRNMEVETRNFRLRVLDLIEIAVSQSPSMVQVQCIEPMIASLQVFNSGGKDTAVVFQKLVSTYRKLLVFKTTVNPNELFPHLEQLCVLATKASSPLKLNWVFNGLVACIKLYRRSGGDDARVTHEMESLLNGFTDVKHSKLNTKFFLQLIQRLPEYWFPIASMLAGKAGTACSAFLQTQAVLLTEELLSQSGRGDADTVALLVHSMREPILQSCSSALDTTTVSKKALRPYLVLFKKYLAVAAKTTHDTETRSLAALALEPALLALAAHPEAGSLKSLCTAALSKLVSRKRQRSQ